MESTRAAVVVPTLNGGEVWRRSFELLIGEKNSGVSLLIIDSGSNDGTVELVERADVRVKKIPKSQFNHGATRQQGVELFPDAEVIVFLTQDAILAEPDSLTNLIRAFDDPELGAASGRQLPRPGAGPVESHARLFNYPTAGNTRTKDDIRRFGIKAVFLSNSFAAYRREALEAVGGFPSNLIFGEDMYVAAKILLSGWKIGYCADARVFHSHPYSPIQELKRSFDIGVFHSSEPWLLDEFGRPEGEGKRFVLSEVRFLLNNKNYFLVPLAIFRSLMKYFGYRMGLVHENLPKWLVLRLSMNHDFWSGKFNG